MKKIKLYRALRTKYEPWSKKIEKEYRDLLSNILVSQDKGGLNWKPEFAKFDRRLQDLMRRQRAFFADNIGLTERYARNGRASFLTIEVPMEDVFKYFHVEFQNFHNRKKQLEMVYTVSTRILESKKQEWNLRIE